MNEIERNIAKLECGEICGNAILLNDRYALTVKHCIEPYINDGEKITLYCYNESDYIAREAEAVAYPDNEDGYAILKLEWGWLVSEISLMAYPVRPFEKCTSIGFNHNHNEKPSWRKLDSNGNSNVKLEDMVCDLMFIDASKEKSVEGLSGSPILLGEGSNIVIGLITQQKLEKGNAIEIAGISVLSQKEFLFGNGIEVKTKTCLFGETSKSSLPELEKDESVVIYNNDIDTVQSDIIDAIKTYCDGLNAKDYSDDDLEMAYARLFKLLTINGIQAEPIKKIEINEVLQNILKNSADNKAAMIKYTSERKFYSDNAHVRDLHPARLDADGGKLIEENLAPRLLPDEFPKIQPVIADIYDEGFPSNLFGFVEQHIADKSDSRHIYLSATSGSGKTTCLYGLWEKYLNDDTKYIPIYVAMHEVSGSLKGHICDKYLSHGTVISNFDWLKSSDFLATGYHILLLLDGYNEIAVNMDPEIDKTIKDDINDILGFERVTVVISSRDPIEGFKASITNLKLCPLAYDQIKILMGGHEEYLPEDKFEGILSNPFMLELCIKTFADDKNKLKYINEISEEEIIREYLKKQIEGYKKEAGKERGLGIELSPLDIVYIDVVLPLAAMKLDERKNKSGDRETIGADPKKYSWNDFSDAVMDVQENFLIYRPLVQRVLPNSGGYNQKYLRIVSEEENGNIRLLRRGVALELFAASSEEKEYVKWDHEIYRDYFVARGYAIYCAYNDDFEDCVHNLAKQVNYRYPEPYEDMMDPYVGQVVRGSHLRKAQMFIDMVEDKVELDTDYLRRMKRTAVYRRLTRDVAFIYEDLNSYKMARAAEVSMKYYSEDLAHYNTESKYDYPDRDRRYADAAYSISGLGYIWGHAKVSGDKTKRDYLNMDKDALERADRMFDNLEKTHSTVLENITVQDDRVKKQGNWAAYYSTLSEVVRRENLEESRKIHEANLEERIRIRNMISDNDPVASMIDNSIAQTYIGIATACFKLGKYDEAVANNEKSISIRPEGKYQEIFTAHRNIVGAYTNMSDKTLAKNNKILDGLKWVEKAFDYANEHDIHKDYKDLNDKADKLIRIVKDEKLVKRLSEETRSECQKALKNIAEKREIWAEKSLLRE